MRGHQGRSGSDREPLEGRGRQGQAGPPRRSEVPPSGLAPFPWLWYHNRPAGEGEVACVPACLSGPSDCVVPRPRYRSSVIAPPPAPRTRQGHGTGGTRDPGPVPRSGRGRWRAPGFWTPSYDGASFRLVVLCVCSGFVCDTSAPRGRVSPARLLSPAGARPHRVRGGLRALPKIRSRLRHPAFCPGSKRVGLVINGIPAQRDASASRPNFGRFGADRGPSRTSPRSRRGLRAVPPAGRARKRKNSGLEGVLREIFPIESYDKTISLEYIELRARQAALRPTSAASCG